MSPKRIFSKLFGYSQKTMLRRILALLLLSAFGHLVQYYRSNCPVIDYEKPVKSNAALSGYCKQPMEAVVMSLDYWEQSGSALASLYNLQCWASSVGIKNVVEPDVVPGSGSVFKFSNFSKETFKDYFDIDEWNKRSQEHENSKLVTWKFFFWYSYKDIVYVQILHPSVECKYVEEISHLRWFLLYGYNIHTICVPFNISDANLKETIFGINIVSFPEVSVIFQEWRGISPSRDFRLRLQGTKCGSGYSYIRTTEFRAPVSTVVVSKKIMDYYQSFVKYVLNGTNYTAIMLRNERLHRAFVSSNETENLCLNKLSSDHNKVKLYARTSTTILFSDLGSHGSGSLHKTHVRAPIFTKRVVELIKPLHSPVKLDSILEKITKSKDSLLIALLQSTIAANARGLLLVGGGSFQMMTLNRYMEISGGTDNYYFRNRTCHYIPRFNDPSVEVNNMKL